VPAFFPSRHYVFLALPIKAEPPFDRWPPEKWRQVRRWVQLGMTVMALRRSGAPAVGVVTVRNVAELFARADHVVLAAPATPETRQLFHRDVLRQAKRGLHQVNVARGSLLDQDVLLEALDHGQVARASLEVTEPEPLPAGHRF